MSLLNDHSKRRIALHAGGDLAEPERAEVRRSIESCPDCREHWVAVRGYLDLIERTGRSETSAGGSLWPQFHARLNPVVARRAPERFNGWLPAMSMAAACIALLIAGQLESGPMSGGDAAFAISPPSTLPISSVSRPSYGESGPIAPPREREWPGLSLPGDDPGSPGIDPGRLDFRFPQTR